MGGACLRQDFLQFKSIALYSQWFYAVAKDMEDDKLIDSQK